MGVIQGGLKGDDDDVVVVVGVVCKDGRAVSENIGIGPFLDGMHEE